MHDESNLEHEKKRLLRSALLALLGVGLLWLVKLAEMALGHSAAELGIYPRTVKGLPGILLAPLIHGDRMHLYSNSIPLFVLVTGLFYYYHNMARAVLVFVYLIGNAGVWLFARPSFHIGASGIIYGLVTFIFFSGVFRKERPAIALSLIVTFLYGSMIWGVLPIQPGVSWEAHLSGAVCGLLAAVYFRWKYPPRKHAELDDWEYMYAAGYNEDGDFVFDDDDDYRDDPERGIYR
ncbi:MAG: rhomboid family intramembrane serine protease [Leptospiraceae bacterium]|nr:rhomboid family intramembrane serine protease [Leptospiraceae bacterium]MCB1316397.1 rhomboid family intramembrane serine protease [Leptospiraceae bacterium]